MEAPQEKNALSRPREEETQAARGNLLTIGEHRRVTMMTMTTTVDERRQPDNNSPRKRARVPGHRHRETPSAPFAGVVRGPLDFWKPVIRSYRISKPNGHHVQQPQQDVG